MKINLRPITDPYIYILFFCLMVVLTINSFATSHLNAQLKINDCITGKYLDRLIYVEQNRESPAQYTKDRIKIDMTYKDDLNRKVCR